MEREPKQSRFPKENILAITNIVIPNVKAAGLFGKGYDEVDEKYKKNVYQPLPEESGWDRLKSMFIKDEYGSFRPEMLRVANGAVSATFFGSIVGGYVGSQNAAREFLERSKVLKFTNDIEKQTKMAADMRRALLRSGFYWSWRCGLYTGTYLFIVSTISVYRNKSSLMEYVLAGGVVGSMFRFNAGLKRMCAAGLMGSAIGAMAGGISLGFMWLLGSSIEEDHYWHNQHKLLRLREIEETGPPSSNTNLGRPADLTTDTFPPI